jgi:hypothetical protein
MLQDYKDNVNMKIICRFIDDRILENLPSSLDRFQLSFAKR